MKRTGEYRIVWVGLAVGMMIIFQARSQAVEILVNGNLEASVSPVGWNLTTSITGQPGVSIPSIFEHNDSGNQPTVIAGERGILIHPQAGNQGSYAGQNLKTNLLLDQTVNGVVGRTYTFSGFAYFGGDNTTATNGYSGGVTTLDPMSPSPNAPSPTQTTFEVAFLDSIGNLVNVPNNPSVLDLRTVQANDSMWHQQTLTSIAAPAGTSKVRVRAAATNMVDNFGFQNAQLDNFTLRDSVVTGLERLTNGNLNAAGDPAGFTKVEGPVTGGVTPDVINYKDFANHGTGGHQGIWIRPYVNTTQFEPDLPTVDGLVTQTVVGHAGAQYALSAWTAWEAGFCGGTDPSVQMILKMEYLNGSNTVLGTQTLNLRDAGMTDDLDGGNIEPEDWRQFTLNGTSPANTTQVRITIGGMNMYNSFSSDPQSAFFDDFSLNETIVGGGVAGDYNGNGVVDMADYVLWRNGGPLQNDPTPGIQATDYDFWRSRFGATSGSGSGLGSSAVPEPTTTCLMLMAIAGGFAARRRES